MRVRPSSTNVPDLHKELLHWRSGALIVLSTVVFGAIQGLLWSRVAPSEQYFVAANGEFGGLPTESYHQFTSIAIFALLGVVVGVAVATAVWHWRSIRGTIAVVTVVVANLLGALTAYLIGGVLATGVDPSSVGPSDAQSVVTAPPTLGNLLVIVVQPALAVAVYTFLALWNGNPNLGRPTTPDDAAAIGPRTGTQDLDS
jgi:hypothetical protein